MAHKLKFPSDDEYMNMINRLPSDLNLTKGNCGIFALALNHVFDVGQIVGFLNESGISHILLKYKNKYYDGEGIWSYNEIEIKWRDEDDRYEKGISDDYIHEETFWNINTDEMEKIILSNCKLTG